MKRAKIHMPSFGAPAASGDASLLSVEAIATLLSAGSPKVKPGWLLRLP
jgi:hypothetical protein